MSATISLATALITRPSVTPEDNGCQDLLIERLEALGFAVERMRFGDVDNFWARKGSAGPMLAFAGHTDVVPPGPLTQWESDPFAPTIRNGVLMGRGAADMKGSLAAITTALERFVGRHSDHNGSLGMLVTSDEEGPGINGTVRVLDTLTARGESIDWCVVGEPTSVRHAGDMVKNGRRGSLSGRLVILGEQGHVAYPDKADNPVHRAAPFLADICAERWDAGNSYFPPTTFQVSNISAGTGATNVIPGSLEILFNLRYSTETDAAQIQQRVTGLLEQHRLYFDLSWEHSAQPFLTTAGPLLSAVQSAASEIFGTQPDLSTSGGTSDGRFFAQNGAEVVELGPVNETIHKVNEQVSVADLDRLSECYERIMSKLLL